VYSIPWVPHAISTACNEYSIQQVQHTRSTAYSIFSIHRVHHWMSTACTKYSIYSRLTMFPSFTPWKVHPLNKSSTLGVPSYRSTATGLLSMRVQRLSCLPLFPQLQVNYQMNRVPVPGATAIDRLQFDHLQNLLQSSLIIAAKCFSKQAGFSTLSGSLSSLVHGRQVYHQTHSIMVWWNNGVRTQRVHYTHSTTPMESTGNW